MDFVSTDIPGLVLIRLKKFVDARGFFVETFRKDIFDRAIGRIDFVQDNESHSSRDVLRGLHLQRGGAAQAKLVRVVSGCVYDVAVDLRPDSPTRGKWFGTELSAENALMMFIPRGFAHGFMVLSEQATFVYKVDNYYAPEAEVTIAYDDADINITWPKPHDALILSQRDKERAITLRAYMAETQNPFLD